MQRVLSYSERMRCLIDVPLMANVVDLVEVHSQLPTAQCRRAIAQHNLLQQGTKPFLFHVKGGTDFDYCCHLVQRRRVSNYHDILIS